MIQTNDTKKMILKNETKNGDRNFGTDPGETACVLYHLGFVSPGGYKKKT